MLNSLLGVDTKGNDDIVSIDDDDRHRGVLINIIIGQRRVSCGDEKDCILREDDVDDEDLSDEDRITDEDD